jgi:signal transduction histidine kinase
VKTHQKNARQEVTRKQGERTKKAEGNESRTHKVSFRPRARLVSILGEHLISDDAVGLIELVKNAYDADATEVEIQLLGLANPETTTVLVKDNGSGMTLGDVEGKWLSPAVDHKEQEKRHSQRTRLGRLPIGEKGVGRFAVHKIGKVLELITRAADSPEVVVPINWDRFDSGDAYLDSVDVKVQEREPQVFLTHTGTLIKMRHSRSQWTRQLLEKTYRTLRRLQSPLKDKDTQFRITLKCPDFPEYENIDPTDILEKAHYEFQALIEADGQCDFEYHCRHPALPPRNKSGSENLVPLARKELHGAEPRCGPFWVNLYVWDRTKDYLARAGISPRELSAQSGVSLFRDGLRVLPYGEPGDDWLLLDQERIQDPSGRIGNNQVIGLIQVLQERNLQLRDKTNREGLIENDAFLDLRAMSRAAIRLFTTYWKKDRPRESSPDGRVGKAALTVAKQFASALKETVSDEVSVKVPAALLNQDSAESADTTAEVQESDKTTLTQKQAVDLLIQNIDGAAALAREKDRRIERLLTLAATGLAAERVVHEFGRQVTGALEALADVRRALRNESRGGHALEILEVCLATLRKEFRILAPFEAVDRAQKAREFSVQDTAQLALTLNKRFIEESKVETAVDGDDFLVRGRPAAIVQVLDNLVHNACYWLGTLPAGRKRQLAIIVDSASRRIVVADSGPGVHAEAESHLFQPFFSMKAGGTGLGLFISREIMQGISGSLSVASAEERAQLPEWVNGAVFVLKFDGDSKLGQRRNGDGHG